MEIPYSQELRSDSSVRHDTGFDPGTVRLRIQRAKYVGATTPLQFLMADKFRLSFDVKNDIEILTQVSIDEL